MASRKDLKKDIDYLVYELIADCYSYIYDNPDMDLSGFEVVINEAIQLKEDLVSRINQYNPAESGKSKRYFRSVRHDMVNGLKEAYEKLDAIIG